MDCVKPGQYSIEELARKLFLDTDGNWPFEAAARLVGEHRFWLDDPDFYRFIHKGSLGGREYVAIDWREIADALDAGEFDPGNPEVFVLGVGASIATGRPVSLRDASNQSPRAMTAVMRAIAHAGGYGEEGLDEMCPLLDEDA